MFWPRSGVATWLSRPVDGAGLAAFRILLGLVLLTQTLRFWANGWIESLWLAPEVHFTWAGFDWVSPLPGAWMYLAQAVQAAAALALVLGWRTRIAALVFFVVFTYGELIDKALYLNHYYLVSLLTLLCVALPVAATCSLDARRRGARAVPAGAYLLLRVQIACVYVFAGLAKLSSDWLLAGEPLGTWLQAHHELAVIGPLLDTPTAAIIMSWAGMLHDLAIVPLVLWRRTRVVAFAIAVVFHGAITLLFPVGVFSFVMLAGLTICLPPTWPRRVLASFSRLARRLPASPHDPARTPSTGPPGRLAIGLGAAWILIQIAVPLRHLAYPGDVDWSEEGFRFAWRVMLIEKTGHVELDVTTTDPPRHFRNVTATDTPPGGALTPLQRKMMSTQPDMILDHAHRVADWYRDHGFTGVAVHADAWVSFNGRPSQRFIDPDADLVATPRGLARMPWILPSPRD